MKRLFAAVLSAAVAAAPARAQEITSQLVGEIAGDDVSLVLLGVTAVPEGIGVKPVFSVLGYRVGFPAGATGTSSLWSVNPSVGLRYRTVAGFLEGNAGYAFVNSEGNFPFFGGGESGVTTGLHAEYWGTGAFGVQGIVNYNWGSEYFWSRARATARLLSQPSGALHAGGELGWQGDLTDVPPGQEAYEATMVGPVVQWIAIQGWILGVGAGWKDASTENDGTWYLRTEIQIPVR
ncbi:MAG TPA: hypothetical protein VMN39_09645 [Longimicrobiaceae bacterium]|nr:hypothetical protein [Longimicrobiaceae bacterium]